MKFTKKILIAVLSVVATCCAFIGVNANINVSAAGTANESDYLVLGGAVKLQDERGAGVKFHIVMTENYFNKYGTIDTDGNGTLKSGVTTGTLLLPYHLTNGIDLTVGGTGYSATVYNAVTNDVWHKTTIDGNAYMQSVVFLYHIPDTDFGTEISVRGYIAENGEYTYTKQVNGISMSFVAKAEYDDENSALTAAEKASLKQTYLDKKVTYHVNGTVTEETVDYLGLSEKYPAPAATLADGSEFVGWTTKNGTIVKNVSSSRVKNNIDLYAAYRQKMLMTADTVSLSLANYDGYTVESIKIGDYDLGTNSAAITIPTELKNNTQKHGEQNATVVLSKDGEKFTATLPVLFVTKEIATMEELENTVRYYGTDINGYYILANDVSYKEDGFAWDKAASVVWGASGGFIGTLDGRGKTITLSTNVNNFAYGLFGTMNGTLKNVTIKAMDANNYSKPIIARTCSGRVEDVNIEIYDMKHSDANRAYANSGTPALVETAMYGATNNVWKNVNVTIDTKVNCLFPATNVVTTFENCKLTVTDYNGIKGTEKEVEGWKVKLPKEPIYLENVYDFELIGEYSGTLSLEEGYKDATITKIIYNGTDITTAIPDTLKTNYSIHGTQQTLTVTLDNDDELIVKTLFVTKAIRSMEELENTVRYYGTDISGYYILANDVSYKEDGFAWDKAASFVWGASGGFVGTLDGRGKTITLSTNVNNFAYGLFGTMNGTLKNVTIKAMDANNYSKPIIARTCSGRVEDVNIEIYDMKHSDANRAYANSGTPALVETAMYGATNNVWKNVNVTIDTKVNCLFPATNVVTTFENCKLTVTDYNGIKGTEKEVEGWDVVLPISAQNLQIVDLNIVDGSLNNEQTYTFNVDGLTENNFVSASFDGEIIDCDGLTFNVAQLKKKWASIVLK